MKTNNTDILGFKPTMKLSRWGLLWLTFGLSLWVGVQTGYSQGLPGTVTGTVVDQSQAIVPGATVLLQDEASGALRRTVSNTQGFFSITAIPAGTYTVTIESTGLVKWQRTGVVIHPGDRVNLRDIALKVGAVTEQVTVQASPEAVIPLDSGEKSEVITAKQIQNLSIVGRNAVELLKILPGVVNSGGDTGEVTMFGGGVGSYNVAGTRGDSLDVVSDGANVIDPFSHDSLMVTPNVEMVQEVKVQTANFSAENAKGPVVFQSVTKSGSSAFHGDAYFNLRHNKLNATDWLVNRTGTAKPKDTFYYPGFNIGGPLTKGRDKLFFFFGAEWMRQNVALDVIPTTVPTEAMRRGDFSDVAYINSLNGYDVNTQPLSDEEGGEANGIGPPLTSGILSGGRINPAFFDKGGEILLNQYPLPNLDPAQNNGFNFVSSILNPQHRNQQRFRLDYHISDNTKLYTVFNHEGEKQPSPYHLWWAQPTAVPYPTPVIGQNRSYSTSTSLVNVFNPTTTNEVVFAATFLVQPQELEDRMKVSRQALGYPYQGVFKNNQDLVPNVTDWGGGVADMIQAGGFDPVMFGDRTIISAADNFTKVQGKHTLKLGGYFQFTTNNGASFNSDMGDLTLGNWGGNSTGNGWADLLLGRIAEYSETTPNPVGRKRWREFSFYVQDSWKATPRLTWELGARFYHMGFMYETHGWLAGFDPNKYDPTAPIDAYSGLVAPYRGDDVPRSIFRTPFLRVGPRIGFAYDLTGKGNTVIRGGAGSFLYRDAGVLQENTHANPPLQRNVSLCCGMLLSEIDQIDPQANVPTPTLNQVLDPYDDHVPTTYSWSLTLSHRLPGQTILEASYVGTSGRNQLNSQVGSINAVPEGAMLAYPLDEVEDLEGLANSLRPYQNYSEISLRKHELNQNYHSFQLTANRWTGRFNYSAAYTFSKALGIAGATQVGGVDPFDMRGRSYGPLDYDRTHRLSFAYNLLLPNAVRNPFLGQVLNGWQVSGITQFQSGSPLQQFGHFAGTFQINGTMANGQPMGGDLGAIFVAGTPDTSLQPLLTCDPRNGRDQDQYANPNCFASPSPGQNGNYQFPYLRRPAFQNHDLSLFKNFPLGKENRKLQFRFSMFNFVNHPLWVFEEGDPGYALNFDNGALTPDSIENFGRPIKKRGRRLIQLGLRFSF